MMVRGTMVSLAVARAGWVRFRVWPMPPLPMSGSGLGRGWGGPLMASARLSAPNPTFPSVGPLQEERSP